MDISEASKITIIEETDGNGVVFKTAQGFIVTAADEDDGLYVPGTVSKELIQKCKTRFFRIRAQQGAIVLTPIKIQLEVVDGEECTPDDSRGGKNPLQGDNLGRCEGSPKLKPVGGI
jgi:hypothetical protein